MLQPIRIALLLALLASAAFVTDARAQQGPGQLDELGCRDDWASASYKCFRPPLAGRSFSSKQDALKRLEQLRAAPKPATKPKAAAPTPPPKQPANPAAAASRPAPVNTGRAAKWAPVANGDGAQYFLDMANLEAKGRTITARTLTRYDSPRSSSSIAAPYRSTVSVERYDCGARTYALSEMRYHAEGDGAGKAMETVDIPDDQLTYLAPLPGSVNEQMLNQVCSGKR